MEFNDDNLRDHLRDTRINVPDEFSWEAMQGGIMERIAEQETRPAIVPIRRYWWAVVPFLIGSSLIIAYKLGSKSQSGQIPVADAPRYATEQSTGTQEANAQLLATEAQVTDVTVAQDAADIAQEAAQKVHNKDAPIQNETITLPTHSAGTVNAAKGRSNQTTTQPQERSEVEVFIGSQHATTPTQVVSSATTGQSTLTKIEDAQLPPLVVGTTSATLTATTIAQDATTIVRPALAALQVLASENVLPIAYHLAIKTSDIRVHERMRGTPWRAAASYGTAYTLLPSQPKYTLPEYIQASEKGLLSQYARVMVHRNMYRGLSAGVGAEWLQINSQLDYQSKTPTTAQLQGVTLLKRVNAITRDTTLITGDTVVNAVATRTVRHFNQATAINIPVVIGYHKNFGRWSAGAELGATFNLNTAYSGKTYDISGQVIDLASDGALLKKNTGVSLLSGIQVGYRVLPQAVVLWQLEAGKYLTNGSAEVDVVRRPMLFRTGIVLQYRF